jgi:type II secretory pathway pseudopilin PulG
MVVVVVASVVLMLAAPSFRNMIEMQRLRAAKSQLVTDMQFARSEATARNQFLRVAFRHTDGVMTCYSLYTAPSNAEVASCNCLLGAGVGLPRWVDRSSHGSAPGQFGREGSTADGSLRTHSPLIQSQVAFTPSRSTPFPARWRSSRLTCS